MSNNVIQLRLGDDDHGKPEIQSSFSCLIAKRSRAVTTVPRERARPTTTSRRASWGGPTTTATTPTSYWRPGTTPVTSTWWATIPWSASAHFNTNSHSSNSLSIQVPGCILGISWILKLNERKPRRIPRNPDILQRSIVTEHRLQLALGRIVTQVPDIHLAPDVPLLMSRHLQRSDSSRLQTFTCLINSGGTSALDLSVQWRSFRNEMPFWPSCSWQNVIF